MYNCVILVNESDKSQEFYFRLPKNESLKVKNEYRYVGDEVSFPFIVKSLRPEENSVVIEILRD